MGVRTGGARRPGGGDAGGLDHDAVAEVAELAGHGHGEIGDAALDPGRRQEPAEPVGVGRYAAGLGPSLTVVREVAQQLIGFMSTDWDHSRYHDTYQERIAALIERKAAGGDEIVTERAPEPAEKVAGLLEALRRSVAERTGAGRATSSGAERMPE